MKSKVKVNIFLVAIAVGAIIIAIFALSRTDEPSQLHIMEYEEGIRELSDSIRLLKDDIAKYKVEIERIDLEREQLRKKLKQIIEDNEKVDIELANGDWDNNIKFLTDFLSEENSD